MCAVSTVAAQQCKVSIGPPQITHAHTTTCQSWMTQWPSSERCGQTAWRVATGEVKAFSGTKRVKSLFKCFLPTRCYTVKLQTTVSSKRSADQTGMYMTVDLWTDIFIWRPRAPIIVKNLLPGACWQLSGGLQCLKGAQGNNGGQLMFSC